MRRPLSGLAALLILFAIPLLRVPAADAARTGYTVTDLGTLGGRTSEAFAINAQGQIAGSAATKDGFQHAFLWSEGRMQDLGTLGGSTSTAYALNDIGQVVGTSGTGGDIPEQHAFTWRPNLGMSDLSLRKTEFSEAYGVSNLGQVVGLMTSGSSIMPALLSEQRILPTSGEGVALGINDSGMIVGSGAVADGVEARVWESSESQPTGLTGLSAGLNSEAKKNNRKGDSVGFAQEWSREYPSGKIIGITTFAVMWERDGPMRVLGWPHGTQNSIALDINNQNQIVGYGYTKRGRSSVLRAFLRDADHLVALNSLIPSSANWELEIARSINDRGQIVGLGRHHGIRRAFLLMPK